jgi:hypothetical protein
VPRSERPHPFTNISVLRGDGESSNGAGDPAEIEIAAIRIADAVDSAGQVYDALAAEDLPGSGFGAESRGEVESSSSEPITDRYGLTRIEPHTDRER